MKRIDYLTGQGPVKYPEDVALLREQIHVLAHLPATTIERLYRRYSGDVFSAGWMGDLDTEDRASSFERWLLAEVDPNDL